MVEKNIKFEDLLNFHFSIPIDRISKFLNMLKHEFINEIDN